MMSMPFCRILRHSARIWPRSREAGGKGVNISRALCNGGIPNTAVIVLGKENCGDFKASLAQSGIPCVYLEKEGRIRENLTLHCAESPETRISFAGFAVDESILSEVLAHMQVDADTVVTFTGRVPSGIPIKQAKEFLKALQAMGARIVLDSKSFSAEDVFEICPWLIKPNQEEIAEYLGCDVENPKEVLEKAAVFSDRGVTNVLVSLGEQGALLRCGGKVWLAVPPVIHAVSTVGAGDSTIAGFLAAFFGGGNEAACLKNAVAYGTAACLTSGTLPPRKADVEKIYTQVDVKEVV